jgi:hypothetical protein
MTATTKPVNSLRAAAARNTLALRHASLFLVLLLVAGSAWAGTFAAYGPQAFTRTNATPAAQKVTFDVADPSARYELKIQTGGVTSAIVSVNGAEIFDTNDFKKKVPLLVAPVTLAGHNELSVELRGTPGEQMIVTVVGYDDVAPTVTATATPAANAAGWNRANVTVTFACSDATSGIADCPASVLVSADGAAQVVSATAHDKAGNAATASVIINLDKTQPVLTVTSPASGSTATTSQVTITGSATDALSGVTGVTCNGAAATLSGSGFTCTVNLATGTNTIELAATDRAGNIRTLPLTLLYNSNGNGDTVPPTITATATPVPNAAGWNNSSVTVTFTCADNGGTVAFCSAPVVVSLPGTQVVTGSARDAAGNAATTSISVRIDTEAPTVAIEAPAANTVFADAEATITGTAIDLVSGITSVTCNGNSGTVTDGSFTCVADLAEGPNTIAVAAYDRAGYSATATLQVVHNATPRVAIIAPANLAFFNISPVTVRGTISDPNATVRVNGVSAVVSGGMFTATVPVVEGNNTLSAIARSQAGKIGTGSVQVTLDTTPPRIAVNTPSDRFETVDSTITVAGMVNDIVVGTVNDEQAQVTVGGVAATVANRTFAAQVPLQVGENSIPIIARDRVGNNVTARVTVIRLAATEPVIRATSGNNQTGIIGRLVNNPLVVTLTDAAGAPVAGKPVVFKITSANGQLRAGTGFAPWTVVMTDAAGRASVDYVLGTRAGSGNNRVEATATGFAGTAVFVASATPFAAAQLNVDAGQGQTGAVNEALAFPFVVVVTDAGHNRLAGVPVTFTVVEGGGHLENKETTLTAVTDTDGRALTILTLGTDPGADNNLVHATMPGYTSHPAAFTATAKVPGNEADTKITGVVLDNSNQPLAGTTLRLYQAYLGSNSNLPLSVATPVVTDEQGAFVMTGVPVGAYKLVADGTTIPSSNRYPSIEFDIVTVAGQENTVGLPIYLPALDPTNRLCVSETLGGTLTLPSVPGFAFTVAPGAATFPGGARTGCLTVTPVHGDKVPMVPGFGQQPRFVVTVQPVGTHFNPPAQISFPNVDGLQPREVTEMYSYDHDLSTFISIGTGSVSDDGSVLRSDPGVGVMKAGWHCGGNPNPTGAAATCPECKKCQGGNCVPKAGPCDDKDQCTENDQCVNGACKGTPVDLGGIINDSTFGAEVNLPAGLVDKANAALHYIPGLGGVNFEEAKVGFSGTAKNCCDKVKGKIEHGLKEGELEVSLSVDLKSFTLWGPPTISKQWDFGVVVLDTDLELGVKFTGSISLNAKGGLRKDECKGEQCAYGSVGGSAGIGLKATASAIGCIETWATDKGCAGLTITPAAINTSISGSVGYNLRDCKSGWDGKFAIGKVVFKAEISPNIPGVGALSYEYEIFGGISF